MSTELEQLNERLRRANTGYGKVTAQLVAERDEWKARAENAEAQLAKSDAILRKYMVVGPVDDLAEMKAEIQRLRREAAS